MTRCLPSPGSDDARYSQVLSAFGDMHLNWAEQVIWRDGNTPVRLSDQACDAVLALLQADGFQMTGEGLWRATEGGFLPFDGDALEEAISGINREIAALDLELRCGSFAVRLVDVTPCLLRRGGRLMPVRRGEGLGDLS
jgi:hypothetical protein